MKIGISFHLMRFHRLRSLATLQRHVFALSLTATSVMIAAAVDGLCMAALC